MRMEVVKIIGRLLEQHGMLNLDGVASDTAQWLTKVCLAFAIYPLEMVSIAELSNYFVADLLRSSVRFGYQPDT